MDLNVAVSTSSELFDDNDIVFPILMGRENLKILASPGSESSGVSSLDAEEAKKLANEQRPASSTPILASEPSSTVQTETETESSDGGSDGGSDGDDEKPIEQKSSESVQMAVESDEQSNASTDDEDKDDMSEIKESSENGESDDCEIELVSNEDAQQAQYDVNENDDVDDDKASIDLDEIRYKNLKIMHDGRDILDFTANVVNKSWNVQYAHLPEQNYQMYMNNRSQYNRLASGYESPEHYSLSTCNRCIFQFPVLGDIAEKADQPSTNQSKLSVNDLLTQTVNSLVNRDSPLQTLNALAQKLTTTGQMNAISGQSMNLNNFMLNNNAATPSGQSYAYQNRNQYGNNITSASQHSCYKQNNNSNNNNTNNNNNANAFYGNNMVLNALVNQIGNNMNNSSAFNSNFMNALNGTNNSNHLNHLGNTALASLMNQNRQQQQQQQQQQLYGMCRQNINKSGINFNANSHKPMPTYSHF